MKDMREYLRGEMEEYRGMMDEEDEYGEGVVDTMGNMLGE